MKQQQIKNFGFLSMDLFSVAYIGNKVGFLYVFNFGNYGKIRNYLSSRCIDYDGPEINDWLDNRLRDEGLNVDCRVQDMYMLENSDLVDDSFEDLRNVMCEMEKESSIGKEFLCIEFKIGQ